MSQMGYTNIILDNGRWGQYLVHSVSERWIRLYLILPPEGRDRVEVFAISEVGQPGQVPQPYDREPALPQRLDALLHERNALRSAQKAVCSEVDSGDAVIRRPFLNRVEDVILV